MKFLSTGPLVGHFPVKPWLRIARLAECHEGVHEVVREMVWVLAVALCGDFLNFLSIGLMTCSVLAVSFIKQCHSGIPSRGEAVDLWVACPKFWRQYFLPFC